MADATTDVKRVQAIFSDSPAEPPRVASRPVTDTIRTSPDGDGLDTPSTDVGLLLSFGIGIVVAAVFYGALWPFRTSGFGQVFFNPNTVIAWVPPVEVLLSAWAMSILFLKGQKRRVQEASMKLEILPSAPSDISPSNVDVVIDHVRNLPGNWRRSFLVTRVLRALSHFRARQSRPEVASLLASQAEIDMSSVISSFTMLRAFIWSIPILGFIGTVLGIGTAVDGFSGLSDLDQLEQSLAIVTSGLAGAFETTLIALVLSMLIMFPTSASQKAEQNLLNKVDEYCNDALLRRLKDSVDVAPPDWPAVGNLIADAVATRLARSGPELGVRIAASLGQDFSVVMRQEIAQASAAVAEALKPGTAAVARLTDSIAGQMEQAEKLQGSFAGATDAIGLCVERVSTLPDELRARLLHEVGPTVGEQIATSTKEHLLPQLAGCAEQAAKLLESAVEPLTDGIGEFSAVCAAHTAAITELEETLADSAKSMTESTSLQASAADKIATRTEDLARSVAASFEQHAQLADAIHERLAETARDFATLTQTQSQRLAASFEVVADQLERSQRELGAATTELQNVVEAQRRVASGLDFRSNSNALRAALGEISSAVERMADLAAPSGTDP